MVQTLLPGKLHQQIHLRGAAGNPVLQPGEDQLRHQNQHRCHHSALVETAADGQAHNGNRPEARGGGQALDPLVPGHNDGTGTDKADSCNDLGAHPGDIRGHLHFQHNVFAGQGGHGGTDADQDMGAETGGTPLIFPLNTDDTAAEHSQQHPDQDRLNRQAPEFIQNWQHSNLLYSSSMVRTHSSRDSSRISFAWVLRWFSRREMVALGKTYWLWCPRSSSTS